MGERGERLGRKIGYRGRLALLSGAGAVLIALTMLGSAAAGPAAASLTVKPAYHGLVLPNQSIYTSGCGSSAKLIKHFNFHLKTGIGGGTGVAKAGNCGKKTIKGFSTYSDASVSGGFEAVIKLPSFPAAGGSSVQVNLGGKTTNSLTLTDGSASPTCNGNLYYDYYNDTTWEWGYNATLGYFTGGYAYSDSSDYNGVWYNYSYNVASVPSPFNLNNTTYYYHSQGYYYNDYCSVSGSMNGYMSAEIFDKTTGTYMYYTSTNTMCDWFMGGDIYNQTDYGSSAYTDWYGPSGYNYSSGGPFSYNTTLTSSTYSDVFCPTFSYSSSSGTNSSLSMANTTVLTGEWFYINGTFSGSDHYFLVFFMSSGGSVYNTDWAHGSGVATVNSATLGNGVKIASVVMS